MTSSIFKNVLERQEREKKDKKKKGGKKEESKNVGGKSGKRDAPTKIKKNRKERRRDMAKQQKKLNLQKIKADRLAQKEDKTAPAAPTTST